MPFRNRLTSGSTLINNALQSTNYVEGETGWRLGKDGAAQFGSIGALGDVGVTGAISGDSVSAGPSGLWLADGSEVSARLNDLETFANGVLPGTILAGGNFATSDMTVGLGPFTTETGLFIVDTGFVPADGYYQLLISDILFKTSGTGGQAGFAVRSTYSSDGSVPANPTVGSSYVSAYMGLRSNPASGYYSSSNLIFNMFGAAGYRYKFLIILTTPTNPVTLLNFPVSVAYTYVGPMTNSAIGTGMGKGISFAGSAPPPPPPPPLQSYTRTDYATWSRSYVNGSGTRYDDSAYCYQGYSQSGSNGDQSSMVGFNYAAIQSALSGASNIVMKVVFTVAHVYNSSGATVRIGRHNNASKPSTWTNVLEAQVNSGTVYGGSTYTVTLPIAFANAFIAGNGKGIIFGQAGSNSAAYYCYINGATMANKPYLVTTYKK